MALETSAQTIRNRQYKNYCLKGWNNISLRRHAPVNAILYITQVTCIRKSPDFLSYSYETAYRFDRIHESRRSKFYVTKIIR